MERKLLHDGGECEFLSFSFFEKSLVKLFQDWIVSRTYESCHIEGLE